MLTYEIINDGANIERSLYDRLFIEALPDIGPDKLKYGPNPLQEAMWNLLPGNKVRVWKKDDYIVGLECYTTINQNGKNYFYYVFPLIGEDQFQSKSWWYDSGQFEMSADHIKNEGYAGIFFFYSPGSPVSNSCKTMVLTSSLYDQSKIVDKPSEQYFIAHPEEGKWGFKADLI